ncbi:MAG TPA: lipopolysaccharide biosynthesis protein [Deltaproteobacteria bacterium]|nr:MAG: hypothetical protein A2Z79_10100 [Deltaproteobacteria bacterium GWA2_55_82]OGQ63012.1 MAG: hypothetical protein A3I81_06870 [Deltaproteobacteria bacterium RIFCSPLOWO2_02_FULL_55_12]OIJ72976.1 MAG: hypothetical protein A2V21_301105 [Deltaproteobacteria bacterium GWC2_55_46]HBG46015.1 lipopolysaccharide biosynthesis protein [Deltaproteobacteria bacterium]HCY11767.1 lipopolysaccharide biosynthesis protein [Deltaproteobacteria bacterium]
MGSAQEHQPHDLNIGIFIDILNRRRRQIILVTLAAFVLSVIISLLVPKTYSSRTSILPPQSASALSGIPGDSSVGVLAGAFLGISSPSDVWVGILGSATVKDAVIDRFKLRDVYDTDTIEETRKALGKRVTIEKSKEEIISITVEDRVPQRAAEMANAFVEALDRINMASTMTSGGRMRAFIEGRLNETNASLTAAEDEITAFQKANKALKLDDQSKAMIDSYGTLKGTLMAREVALEMLLSYATAENPKAQVLKVEIEELRKKLGELEHGRSGDMLIPAAQFPDLSVRYARLIRDAKAQQTVFEVLNTQYEMARIQEAQDSPTVQVLDVAKAPEKESKPQKAVIVILSTASAFFIAIFLAFAVEFKDYIITGIRQR